MLQVLVASSCAGDRIGSFYLATREGRVPFVHADDIAHVALHALTDPEPHNTDHIITGPGAISYAQAAAMIGEALGQPVEHANISESQLGERWAAVGLPSEYAAMLAGMDTAIAGGCEDRVTDAVLRITRRAPQRFKSFARASIAA